MDWFDWKKAVPVNVDGRDHMIQEGIKRLQQAPFDSRGHRFTYSSTGDTLVFLFQHQQEPMRIYDAKVRRVGDLEVKEEPRLSGDQEKAAAKIRWRSECVNEDDIRPISERDGDTLKTTRAIGLAIWQEREAFVTFFASQDPYFDHDLFREQCKPILGTATRKMHAMMAE